MASWLQPRLTGSCSQWCMQKHRHACVHAQHMHLFARILTQTHTHRKCKLQAQSPGLVGCHDKQNQLGIHPQRWQRMGWWNRRRRGGGGWWRAGRKKRRRRQKQGGRGWFKNGGRWSSNFASSHHNCCGSPSLVYNSESINVPSIWNVFCVFFFLSQISFFLQGRGVLVYIIIVSY